jgi:hypothetical protein
MCCIIFEARKQICQVLSRDPPRLRSRYFQRFSAEEQSSLNVQILPLLFQSEIFNT